jgi:1-acyl-sn-glycerol-3-phosphate acyltransferase
MQLALSALTGRQRSFVSDARRASAHLPALPQLIGAERIPARGPCLVVCNHYTRPGFGAWWLVLMLSHAIAGHRAAGAPRAIHWVMAEAWTYPDSPWREAILTPATRWAFRRVAHTYGFIPMPPMPPRPQEMAARAAAVLRATRLARTLAQSEGMLGLAPEGGDVPGGLGQPPPGAGQFMALLAGAGLPVLPAGVFEAAGRLVLSFGPPFVPDVPRARAERDGAVSAQVMAAIGRQVPGEYTCLRG